MDTRSWKLSPITMPVPHHGHYPILYKGAMLVVGDGEKKGFAVLDSITYLPKPFVVYESEWILKPETKGRPSPCPRHWQYVLPCGACTMHKLVTRVRVHVPMQGFTLHRTTHGHIIYA